MLANRWVVDVGHIVSVIVACAVGVQAQQPHASSAFPSAPIEAQLESSLNGRQVRLSSYRGRVQIGFYEDRQSTDVNEWLKGEIVRFIADNHLEGRMGIMGFGNAAAFNYEPARSLVRTGVRLVSQRIRIDILLDFSGRFLQPDVGCRSGANVVLFDAAGRIVWLHNGAVGPAERTQLFRQLRRLLSAPRAAPAGANAPATT